MFQILQVNLHIWVYHHLHHSAHYTIQMLIFARFQLYSPAEIAASTFLLPKPLIAPSLSLTHSSAFTFIHSIFLILSLVSKVWETHHLTSWWWWCYYCSSRLQPNLYTYIYTHTYYTTPLLPHVMPPIW